MLALIGFLTMAAIIFLLLRSKLVPALAFILVPTVTALLAGFSPAEIGGFVKTGVMGTASMATLFIFSILFFGVMTDAGMFDRIIRLLVNKAGGNVVSVAVMTALIAVIGHLDGSGASTFLITVPAMLPIYKRLNMRPTTLLLICTSAMGVMNLMPWGGPTMRAATVIGVDPTDLWRTLIPMQFVGLAACLVVAVLAARLEIRRGAGAGAGAALANEHAAADDPKAALKRPGLFWFNLALTLAAIASLIWLDVPSYYVFMLSAAIALIVNYPGMKQQEKIIKSHAGAGLMMASTLLAAGVLLGVLQESGMMDAMAESIVALLPRALGPYLAIIMGIVSAPLALVFDTDSYFYGVLPIIIGVGESFGVSPMSIAITMVVCRNCATFISPIVPATFLGCGLAEVEINQHIRHSFFWVWGISLVMLVSGIVLGVIPLFS